MKGERKEGGGREGGRGGRGREGKEGGRREGGRGEGEGRGKEGRRNGWGGGDREERDYMLPNVQYAGMSCWDRTVDKNELSTQNGSCIERSM